MLQGPRGKLPGALRKDPLRDGQVDGEAFLRWARDQARRFGPCLVHERHSLFGGFGQHPSRHWLLEVNAPLAWEGALFRGLPPSPALLARERATLRRADSVIAVSTALAQWIGPPAEVVPNGVLARTVAARRERSLFVLGLEASFKPWHGLPAAVGTLATLRAQVGPLAVELVGEGPEREATEQALLRAGVPFTSLGPLDAEALAAARAGWSACWSPAAPWPPPSADAVAAAFGAPLPPRWFAPLKEAEAAAAGLAVWNGSQLCPPAPAPRLWREIAQALSQRAIPPGGPTWDNRGAAT